MQNAGIFIPASKNQNHEPLCSLSDFAANEGIATYQTMINWSKKHPLPNFKVLVKRSRHEVKLYSIAELKQWYTAAISASRGAKMIGKKHFFK